MTKNNNKDMKAQKEKIEDALAQLDEIENFTEGTQDNKNPLEDAAKKLAHSLNDLGRNIKVNSNKSSMQPGYNPLKPGGWKEKDKMKIVHKTVAKNEIEKHETQEPISPEEVKIINPSNEDELQTKDNKVSRKKLPYNPLQPGAAAEYMRRNKKVYNTISHEATPIKKEETPTVTSAEEREIITDESGKVNSNKSSRWPGYNPLKPGGWKEKDKMKIVYKTIAKNEIEKHEAQEPISPEEVKIINPSNEDELQTKDNKASRKKLPYNPLQPGAAAEYMRRNKKVYNTIGHEATSIKKEETPTVTLAEERKIIRDESKKVELLNNLIQQRNNGSKSKGVAKAVKMGKAEKTEPMKINAIDDDFTLEDIFKDNTIDANSVLELDKEVVDISVDEEKELINGEQNERKDIYETSENEREDTYETSENEKNKYKGNNPWIKRCYKEISNTDKQITALAIAKQFINEKPDEIEGAKKVNVVCKGAKYLVQIITDDKKVRTYEISEAKWKNHKKDELLFKGKEPEYKNVMPIKKVLRVKKDKLDEELDKLKAYKSGLEYMKEKLEPINAKRIWKTLGLTRKITTGENKEKLEKGEKQEFKDIRHRVNDINKKFGIHKTQRHERNKDKIIDKYAKKGQDKMPPFGM